MAKRTSRNKSKRRPNAKDSRKRPPAKGDLLRIIYPLGEPDPGERRRFAQYHFDLGERELAAMGYATVQWAFLEESMFQRTALFAKRAKVKTPKDAHHFSFGKRIGALRVLVGATVKDPKRRAWWNSVISAIGKENGLRQKIVHGLWSYDPKHPERLFSSPRPSLGKWMTRFNVDSLFEFGERVGELSFALLNPSPAGRKPKDDGQFFAFVSRSFLLARAGKADDLGFPRSIPLKEPPPLTPSQESLLEKLKPKED